MRTKHVMVLAAVLGLASSQLAMADPTALDLAKKGNDYVGVQSKDKVLKIYSDKSVASLEPNIWYVVYYDPDIFQKTAEVKFGAGQEIEVSRSMRPFQMPAKARDILDMSKVTVDSDRALKVAQEQPLLKGLTLRYSKMTLADTDNGMAWKIELWAAKVNDPTKTASIGTIYISATDESVLRSDLHPDRAT